MYKTFNLRTTLFALFIATILTENPALAWRQDFDLSVRDIVARVDFPVSGTSAQLRVSPPANDEIQVGTLEQDNNGNAKIVFPLTEAQTEKPYVLFVRTQSQEPPFETLSANGMMTGSIPIAGDDGWYCMVSGVSFQNGNNELQFLETVPNAIRSVELASLEFGYEAAHFMSLFGTVRPSAQPPVDPNQLKYDVLHYDLDIKLDMTSQRIPSAAMTITAQSLDPTLNIVPLDLVIIENRLTVTSVDGGDGTQQYEFMHDPVVNKLFITLPSPIPAGETFTVRIGYEGIPSGGNNVTGTNPFLLTRHGNNVPILYTLNQPYGARGWFPCKDIPADKATSDMRITCPNGYKAVSNGTLMETVNNPDGTVTYHWHESYPIATYLISIACTNYREVTATYTALDGVTTMPVIHYSYPETYNVDGPSSLQGTIQIIKDLAAMFGEYPFLTEKYSNAVSPLPGGMEHQTCTTILSGGMMQSGLTSLNIHETAHQWFGDKVTNTHNDHLWLHEGFATYCEVLYYELYLGTATYHTIINSYPYIENRLVSPSADRLDSTVYVRGAMVLHMLRHVVGDEVFFQSIRNYLHDPELAYKTAVSADLQRHFEAEHGASLSWFFDQWLYEAGRPDYEWSYRTWQEGNSNFLGLWVRQSNTRSEKSFAMPVDIETRSGSRVTSHTVWVDNESQSFKIDLGASSPSSVRFDPVQWIMCTKRSANFPTRLLWSDKQDIEFGTITSNQPLTQTLTLENIGTEPLEIQSVNITGEHAGAFTVSPSVSGTTIAPGRENAVTLPVHFNPANDGTYNQAVLDITISNSTLVTTINLSGDKKLDVSAVQNWKEY